MNKLFSYRGMFWTKEVAGKVRRGGAVSWMGKLLGAAIFQRYTRAVTERMVLPQLRWESGEQGLFRPSHLHCTGKEGRKAKISSSGT